MLTFAVTRTALRHAVCRAGQRVSAVGESAGAWWGKRLASGEVRTVRAIPVEGGGLRARLSGEHTLTSI